MSKNKTEVIHQVVALNKKEQSRLLADPVICWLQAIQEMSLMEVSWSTWGNVENDVETFVTAGGLNHIDIGNRVISYYKTVTLNSFWLFYHHKIN